MSIGIFSYLLNYLIEIIKYIVNKTKHNLIFKRSQ